MSNTSFPIMRRGSQLAVSFLCVALLATTVQAYTLVLRNGRMVQIPKTFVASPSTITYEISPGMQVTLQLVTIDIPATDKANRETPGSFLRLLHLNQTVSTAPSGTLTVDTARRSVTNKQLESFAAARTQNELAEEQRRKEQGLPSLAELRLQAARQAAADREKLEQNLRDENTRESYWRERATTLKADIDAVNAEIQEVRRQLDLLQVNSNWNSVTLLNGIVPFAPLASFSRSFISPNLQTRTPRPRVFVAPARGPQSRINVGPIPNQGFSTRFPGSFAGSRRGFASAFSFVPAFSTFGYPSYDVSYELTFLTTRLNELLGQQAALQARWRALEDEARRDGAYPGWLRP